MSWIAKNDITGKTYGKKYSNIYDCQKFIDTELVILQYEWKRIAYLEEQQTSEQNYKKWFKERYGKNEINAMAYEIWGRIEYAITQYGNDNQRSQNVIRCWYVEQERYATGFDY